MMTNKVSSSLQHELNRIKERNQRVEYDKAWEVSWTRRLVIAISTYIIAGVWLILINDTYPLLKAFVPAVGYILSTLSLPVIKKMWVQKYSP